MTPHILFEDESLIAINKPAGVTVNRSETTVSEETIQDWAEEKIQGKSEEVNVDKESDFYKRGGIVHRLDKETSGVLLIAKTSQAFHILQGQFKDRSVKKQYLALAHGRVVPRTGEIRVPVGRLPWNRTQFGIVAGGREAVTHYQVEKYYMMRKLKKILSYVLLFPETGRTHQIRVHLKYIGHPIFADFLYAGRKTAREDRKILQRVFLHARQISFDHPVTRERVTFTADLPSDLSIVLADHCVEVE